MANQVDPEHLGKMMQRLLRELKAIGQPTQFGELLRRTEPELGLTDYDRELLAKSNYPRYYALLQWLSVDCVKAGFLSKSGGRWALTDQSDEAMKLPPAGFVRVARSRYSGWRQKNSLGEESQENVATVPGAENEEAVAIQATYEQVTERAREQIEEHISRLGPYDFQQLVAELLMGMRYHVPYIAPPGPDGGIDIVAYNDPLGTGTPRIRTQIKHRVNNKVTVAEVRALEGVLRKDGDMGLIVSSGGFTSESLREIQISSKHIESMDLDRLITLWQEHYDRIRERGKLILHLVNVFLLAPVEE
ncbi:MAG TPA: restriction endonuclease [Phycisphaerae bacterium]|nr:restriction endonuclease [Phycisphaerae bacterium]HRR87116.1 restriction endonuclease [Phycisphaerae bacterium]